MAGSVFAVLPSSVTVELPPFVYPLAAVFGSADFVCLSHGMRSSPAGIKPSARSLRVKPSLLVEAVSNLNSAISPVAIGSKVRLIEGASHV